MGLLLTPVSGNMDTVRPGDLIAVRWGKRLLGLLRREEDKIFKLTTPQALALLAEELKGAEIFQRVLMEGMEQKGNYAFIIPPDPEEGFCAEIFRGRTKREALRKGWCSSRYHRGALFRAIGRETVVKIETAESP